MGILTMLFIIALIGVSLALIIEEIIEQKKFEKRMEESTKCIIAQLTSNLEHFKKKKIEVRPEERKMRKLEQSLSDKKVWLVAEAGATHTGLDSAINLVDIAVQAGFDAVKFQIVESSKCPHPDEIFNGHKCIDIWKQRELKPAEWKVLKAYCNNKDIYSFTTITDVNQLDWFPSDMYKIRARDYKNNELIVTTGKNCGFLQMDFNGAIKDFLTPRIFPTQLIINITPVGYPAIPESEQLYRVTQFKDHGYIVGYSSHSGDIDNDFLALALGTNILEKPIIEDNSLSIAPEACYALRPFKEYSLDVFDYVCRIRSAEVSLYGKINH